MDVHSPKNGINRYWSIAKWLRALDHFSILTGPHIFDDIRLFWVRASNCWATQLDPCPNGRFNWRRSYNGNINNFGAEVLAQNDSELFLMDSDANRTSPFPGFKHKEKQKSKFNPTLPNSENIIKTSTTSNFQLIHSLHRWAMESVE